MPTNRRKYSSSFKMKVALCAIRGDKTIAEICSQYEVHSSVVHKWKTQLQREGSQVFESGSSSKSSVSKEREIEQLHAKIGQLTMERDFLKQALEM